MSRGRRGAALSALWLSASAVTGPAHAGNGAPSLPTPAAGTCVPASVPAPSDTPWAQVLLGASRVWKLTDGAGVTVAVVDSGVQADAPQLAGRVARGTDVTTPDGAGDADCLGHGTFVAGLIAAQPQPGVPLTGIAPGAAILPIRVTGADGGVTAGTLAAGIRAAVDGGARVINVSAVATVPSPVLLQAVQYAQQHGALIVAAAANDAAQNNPVAYPAGYPGVVGVGAIDANGALAAFSESGPFVALVAPGGLVTSVGAHGGYYSGTGTSFASPLVAGTAALIWAYHPDLTAAQVAARLEATADPPTSAGPGYGHGIVDPYAAVTAVLPRTDTVPPPAPRPAAGPDLKPPAAPAGPAGAQRLAAFGAAGVSLALVLVGGVLSVLIPRGRARGWRASGPGQDILPRPGGDRPVR
jgi:type VII secretion-associated serine protease mycosin